MWKYLLLLACLTFSESDSDKIYYTARFVQSDSLYIEHYLCHLKKSNEEMNPKWTDIAKF